MEKLNLYDVDKDYVSYLKKSEIEKRGFTRVPNMEYPDRKQKFLCGIVMEINKIEYYVPVTSYKLKQSENILIVFNNDKSPIKGSLRFNYMFPIPRERIKPRIIENEPDEKRKIFLAKQLNFFNKNSELIHKKAEKTYKKVIKGYSPTLVKNSCDFKLLEEKFIEYCRKNKLEVPTIEENHNIENKEKGDKRKSLDEQLIEAKLQNKEKVVEKVKNNKQKDEPIR